MIYSRLLNQDTFTLVMKSEDIMTGNITLYKKVLNGFWDSSSGSNLVQSGVESLGSLNLYINTNEIESYVKPKEWLRLSEEEKALKWTLDGGFKVIKGVYEEEFTSYIDLEKRYDDVFTINLIDFKELKHLKHLSHFEVLCK